MGRKVRHRATCRGVIQLDKNTGFFMRFALVIIILPLLGACADLGYYWHSAKGHLAIMQKRVPIDDLVDDPELDGKLKQRLKLVKQIRQFSVDRLALPDSGSYSDFAQLERPYVLQNLFAAPEFSIKLLSWCYPVAGCASYRGYYEQQRLDKFVKLLQADGNEIYIARVPAYSTLGWFDDPVLSSFIHWPEFRLAGLLFHELTHQRLYIDDDSKFNESLASAVQQVGTRLWLGHRQQTDQLGMFDRSLSYRRGVVALIESVRSQLAELYRSELDEAEKRRQKQAIFQTSRHSYEDISTAHDYRDGFAKWFAGELNNAKLASVSTYNALISSFVTMITAHDNDFNAFFDYVEKIGQLDKQQRDLCLQAWKAGNALDSSKCN
ncbi:MAG: aminopeptidase [Gammaproteobacteria bacterium]|nr:aminopeptidase [Gammaproteobacteria bacterium]